jgi:hypothetical protein
MFSTLESTWDQSARRGWTTLASFTMQAFGLSLLLLIPLIAIQGPAKLRWFESPVLAPPPGPAPPGGRQRTIRSSNFREGQLQQPPTIPSIIANLNEAQVAAAPDLDDVGVPGGTNTRGRGVPGSVGIEVDVAPPAPLPAPSHPLTISHWAEGNLIYRVQPIYPPIARQARAFRARLNCGRPSARQEQSKIWSWSVDTRCWLNPRWKRSGNGVTALTC